MAASTLTRTKGQTSTGLVLTFSLLCLVGFASALFKRSDLKKMKENYEKSLQALNSLKAEYKPEMDTISERISGLMRSLDTRIDKQKTAEEGWPDGFPSMAPLLESVKVQAEQLKAYQEKNKEDFDRQIVDIEKNLRKQGKLIKFLEEQQDEL